MVNIWESLTTQDQVDNSPHATEFTSIAATYEEVLNSLKFLKLSDETLAEIRAAIPETKAASASVYEHR